MTTETASIQLIVTSGMSGSGKSVALGALEDMGYFCVDNLPPSLIPHFIKTIRKRAELYPYVAIGVDARSRDPELGRLRQHLELPGSDMEARILFLNADNSVLLRRFSETRRRHPMTEDRASLSEAIADERDLLEELKDSADWIIDTSDTNIHQLRRQVWKCVARPDRDGTPTLVLESFAFKRGVPGDVDLLFDARCLPNPHWDIELRNRTGQQQPVIDFLEGRPVVDEFLRAILEFLRTWLPRYTETQRSYFTVGIGCTGGQHRSVYLADRIAQTLKQEGQNTVVHHRELED